MQWEGGAFSSLVGFGGCGVIVEGCNMNLDSSLGVRHGVCGIVRLEYRTSRLESYIRMVGKKP